MTRASESDWTTPGKTYQPVLDGQGNWSFTVPDADALVDANYVTQVSVTDIAGNRIVAEGARFTIDTTAPALPRGMLDPASDSGVVGDNRTTVRTPTLSGAAEAASTVEVTLIGGGRTVLLSTLADAAGTWKVSVREADALANGSYSIGLKSTDGAGNVGVTPEDATQRARAKRVPIYTVMLGNDPGRPDRPPPPTTLAAMATQTGGVFAQTTSTEDLVRIFEDIGGALTQVPTVRQLAVLAALIALLCLAVAGVLMTRVRRRPIASGPGAGPASPPALPPLR